MRVAAVFLSLFVLLSCSDTETEPGESPDVLPSFISAVDVSFFPEIEDSGYEFRNAAGAPVSLLEFMRQQGVNTARIRLWVNPESERSSLQEVKEFSSRLKSLGYRIWITAHYSDSWAAPGKQTPPSAWEEMDFESLKDEVARYTFQVVSEIQPDIYQIGNEINPGILLPMGDRFRSERQFLELLSAASTAVRSANDGTRIMLHFAGLSGAQDFYRQVTSVDYDLIGVSYYPWWHGKSLGNLQSTLQLLGTENDKDVIVAETAYPFTLGFDDFTNNIIGWESQLYLPQFPATPRGQSNFLSELRQVTQSTTRGRGFCYWAPEWVAYKGGIAEDGSPWENNALLDFEGKALPAWQAFGQD